MRYFKLICLASLCLLSMLSCKKDLDMTVMHKVVLEGCSFNSIRADRAWQIEVVEDECCFVELEYSAYLEPYIKCELEGERSLRLGFNASGTLATGSVNKAKVHLVQMELMQLSESCKVTLVGSFTTAPLTLELKDGASCSGGSASACKASLDGGSMLEDFSCEGLDIILSEDSHFVGVVKPFADTDQPLKVRATGHSSFVNRGACSLAKAEVLVGGGSLVNMAQTEIATSLHLEVDGASEATLRFGSGTELTGFLHDNSTLFYYGTPVFAEGFGCDETSVMTKL